MDYVTRQFINLTKKFRKESRKALVTFHDAIEKNTKATEKAAAAQKEQADTNALIVAAIKNNPVIREHRTKEEIRNPFAWVKLAIEMATLFILLAYTFLTALQFTQLRISADAATNANVAAHDALTRSNRPWLGVESVRITAPIGFIKAGSGKDITHFVSGNLELRIKNYGSSPGLFVNEFIEAYDPESLKEQFDTNDPFAQVRHFGESTCAFAEGNATVQKNPTDHGGSIFPTDIITYTTYGIPGFSKRGAESRFLQLVGCVSYRDQFGEKTHHTHFCVVAPVGKVGPVNNCGGNFEAD